MRIQPLPLKHALPLATSLMLAVTILNALFTPAEEKVRYDRTALEWGIDDLLQRAPNAKRYKKLRRLTICLKSTDRKLPDALAEFRQVHTLRIIGKNEFCAVTVLGKMKQLKALYIVGVLNYSLPDQVGELPLLQELHLIGGGYQSIPRDLSRLKRLRTLDLSYNRLSLERAQEDILSLPQLTALRMDHNPITRFPYRLLDHSTLEYLSLNHCKIAYFKDSLDASHGGQSRLQEVYLDGNELEEVLPVLLDLPELLHLSLADNKLTTFPTNLYAWKRLRQLNVSNNELKQFTEGISLCTNLHYLDLSHNPLNRLPQVIGALYQLEYLTLAYTHVEELPRSFDELYHLKQLDLSGTKLSFFPEALETLPELEEVVIRAPRPRWTAEAVKHRIQEEFQQPPKERLLSSYSKLPYSPLYSNH